MQGIGSASQPETSSIVFEIVDKSDVPIAGVDVNFSLSSTLGGVSLSLDSGVTDAQGQVQTTLNAGTVNTTVVVIASLVVEAGDDIESTSTPIAIHSGLPDQDSFSISATILNPRGLNHEGITSKISIRVSDEFNNPVPDGTLVSFVASGGSVEGSCAVKAGACSVNWVAQDPRPSDGLVYILARSTGQESFVDVNSNGRFDLVDTNNDGVLDGSEEIVQQLDSEAFLDTNSNGEWDSGEFFSDFDNDGFFTKKSEGKYQGVVCSEEAKTAGHCESLVEVRETMTLCMASDTVSINGSEMPALEKVGAKGFVTVVLEDSNGLTPASGTIVRASISGNIRINTGGAPKIPNACSTDGYAFSVNVERTGVDKGSISIVVTQVDGQEVSQTIEMDSLCETSDAVVIANSAVPTLASVNAQSTISFTLTGAVGLTPAQGTAIVTDANGGVEIVAGGFPIFPNECKKNGYSFPLAIKRNSTDAGSITVGVTQVDGTTISKTIDIPEL
ncbi:MAG: hypothetical protein COA99_14985 [Moraxellaceae bacterium]|nr:MAG: hypothetical protein COA99_14985 [Moraxellaceae bacterium]